VVYHSTDQADIQVIALSVAMQNTDKIPVREG
jgi:hypothetical protein